MLKGWNDEWTDADAKKAFATNLRTCRKAAKLNQQQLADKLGYTRAAVSNMERGAQCGTVPTLLRLSWALNCTPNDLLLPRGK